MKQVVIYTDGSCIGNPGPGGFGVVLLQAGSRKELSGGYRMTTNNRMEILAVIAGLRSLDEPSRTTVYSDSQYVVNTIEKGWAKRWKANGWFRNKKERAVNPDLWDALLDLCQTHEVKFSWLRGHSGHVENERCDRLAVAAATGANLEVDVAYESLDSFKN
ncbi:ribonuclease HI [SAR202 cluster bacterium AD-804-J14_MRT_500m]|nr:ribonuclease HI [SAR202 cluster bacterium AD-804-J14_MRT_500m]